MLPRRHVSRLIAILTCWLFPGRLLAQELDPQFLRGLEGRFTSEMARQGVPGGAFAIVREGKLVHSFGTGWADVETERNVVPERTLFYLASVTKPFTATAVLRLVEEGRLDLHRDVNDVLRAASTVRVPAAFDRPVTLHDLLTHTAGFDDKNIGYVARVVSEVRPLAQYLKAELPVRRWAPGEVISYSNHGYGLAGHLIEVASGVDFGTYVRRTVLEPLDMRRTSATLPPPPELARDLATPYVWDPRLGRATRAELGFRNLPPAGTISATVTDMAHFLIAHLESGSYQGTALLKPETVGRMHQRQFTHDSRLPGFAYGFYERPFRGRRVLEHAGGYVGAGALLVLVPELRTGLFVATNYAGTAPHEAVRSALLAHLFQLPDASPAPADPSPLEGFGDRMLAIAGSYHHTRYGRHNMEKIALLDGQIRVRSLARGRLELRPRGGKRTEWVELAPYLFRRQDGEELLSFAKGPDGRVARFHGSWPGAAPAAFERVSWYEEDRTQVGLLLGFLAVFSLAFLALPIGALARWAKGRREGTEPTRKRAAVLAWGLSLLALVFLVGIDGLIGNSSYRIGLIYGLSREMIALLWIPIASIPLTAWTARECREAWRGGRGSLWDRLLLSAVSVGGAAVVAFAAHWNLLGFRS